MIYGNSVGGVGRERTYILVDEEGNEVPAVVVSQEVVFDAVENDIRIGKVAATANGVTTGTKEIPAYVTAEGFKLITANSPFMLPHTYYDYTKLQAMFCVFNTSLTDSVSTDKVVINDTVYAVSSTEAVAAVVKDDINARIDFGVNNDSESRYLIRYFMFKEIY